MTDVVRASIELPTVIFSALLVIAGCMWLLSVAGVLDIEIDGADGVLDDALEPLNLSEVPTTLVLTVFALSGWFVSVLASVFLLDDRSGTALVVWSLVVGLVALLCAMAFVLWLSPRLARMFVTTTAPSKRALLGRIAEVRSATVTESTGRGEATWPDGTVSTVDLRTTAGTGVAPGELKRGDLALLVEWDEQTDDFYVGRVPAELVD
ncbi:MAG: hypothetical protein AB8G14_06245 [Ilumatobacter sp.]